MAINKKKSKIAKPDKYDTTLKLDVSFNDAMKKIVADGDKKLATTFELFEDRLDKN